MYVVFVMAACYRVTIGLVNPPCAIFSADCLESPQEQGAKAFAPVQMARESLIPNV